MSGPAQQRGVALISVLLVFSLIVILLGSRITRDSLDIRRSAAQLQYSQLMQYALGGEELARQLLYIDWQSDADSGAVDHQQEAWFTTAEFEPDRGRMRVTIRDLEARFNLNNLLDQNGRPDNHQLAIFRRLLQQLNLPTDDVNALLDWLDRDTDPRSNSSEDSGLLSLDPPLRSADRPLADCSELVAAGLFNEQQLQILLPHISALPVMTGINPNTASAAVLAALHEQLNPARVIAERERKPYTSREEFLASEVAAAINFSHSDINLRSQYFEVVITAQLEDTTLYLRAVLHRDPESGTMATLSRSLLRPALPGAHNESSPQMLEKST